MGSVRTEFVTYKKWQKSAFYNFIEAALLDISIADKLMCLREMKDEIERKSPNMVEMLSDLLEDVENEARDKCICVECGEPLYPRPDKFGDSIEYFYCKNCGYRE